MSKQEVDRLFELPPEEFTAARNELARRLKDDGDASAAADVKQLSKPSCRHLGDQSAGAGTAGRSQVAAGVGCEIEEGSGERAQERRHGRCTTARAGRRTKGSARAHPAGAGDSRALGTFCRQHGPRQDRVDVARSRCRRCRPCRLEGRTSDRRSEVLGLRRIRRARASGESKPTKRAGQGRRARRAATQEGRTRVQTAGAREARPRA